MLWPPCLQIVTMRVLFRALYFLVPLPLPIHNFALSQPRRLVAGALLGIASIDFSCYPGLPLAVPLFLGPHPCPQDGGHCRCHHALGQHLFDSFPRLIVSYLELLSGCHGPSPPRYMLQQWLALSRYPGRFCRCIVWLCDIVHVVSYEDTVPRHIGARPQQPRLFLEVQHPIHSLGSPPVSGSVQSEQFYLNINQFTSSSVLEEFQLSRSALFRPTWLPPINTHDLLLRLLFCICLPRVRPMRQV
jgi:hypothetical protein